MLTAQEAKKFAKRSDYDQNVFDSLFEDVDFKIRTAAYQGLENTSIRLYCTELILHIDEIIDHLKSLGYTCCYNECTEEDYQQSTDCEQIINGKKRCYIELNISW